MKIISLDNIKRKEVPIFYRRLYRGILKIELMDKTVESSIEFTMETNVIGKSEVIINQLENVDYPLIPLRKEVKNFITQLDESGGLPI